MMSSKSKYYNSGDIVFNTNTNENVKIIFGPFFKFLHSFYEVESQVTGKVYKCNSKHFGNLNSVKESDTDENT